MELEGVADLEQGEEAAALGGAGVDHVGDKQLEVAHVHGNVGRDPQVKVEHDALHHRGKRARLDAGAVQQILQGCGGQRQRGAAGCGR